MRPISALFLLLILLPGARDVSAQSAPEGAWIDVTVLMTDGWRFREATVYLDSGGAGLWVLRPDGAERLITPDRVTQIIAPDGSDITDRVLSGQRGPAAVVVPPINEAPPQDAAVAGWDGASQPTTQAVAETHLMKLAFTLEGGYGWPWGDYFWGSDASWTAGARLRIGTVNRSYLGFGARYQKFQQSHSLDRMSEQDATIYEGTFGWLSHPSSGGTMTYLELGAALVRTRNQYPTLTGHASWYDNTGSFLMRAGVMVPMGQAIALDMSASFAFRGLIFKSDDESDAALLAVHLGLTWHN